VAEVKGYGVSATGWTNSANAVGAPDGSTAVITTVATLTVVMTGAFAALPNDALITGVYVGARCQVANSGTRVTVKLSAGDITAMALDPGTAALVDREAALVAGLFTPVLLKGTLGMTAQRTGTASTVNIDAVWVRVEYTQGSGTMSTLGHATAVVPVSPDGNWTQPTSNALGAPDDLVTSHDSSTAAMKSLTGTFAGLSVIPADATIQQVRWGVRSSCNNSFGRTYLSSLRGDDTVVDAPAMLSGTLALASREYVSAGSWTVAQAKAMKLRWAFNAPSGGFPVLSCDAMWVAVLYAVVAASRAKRWDGSAWVDAPVKRWTGSEYVDATVRRWSGSAWV